jgi:glycerophosphoryl diester phosphodiesterase
MRHLRGVDKAGVLPAREAPHRSTATTSRAHFEKVLPPVIGHRGAAGCAPENTLAGLRKAKELDCRWVEFDVRLTADGELILLHDERLERTTNGRGKAALMPLTTVRRYYAGHRFGPSFPEERVPTLIEAVGVLGELGVGANIELKAARGREAETGAAAAALLSRIWPPHLPEPLISSFLQEALLAAKTLAPSIARGMLFRAVPRNWRVLAEKLGCATIHADHRSLHPALVAEIREAGYASLAYTVNDAARAYTLFGWGVTSVFSDIPHIIRAAAEATTQSAAPDLRPAGVPRQGAVR